MEGRELFGKENEREGRGLKRAQVDGSALVNVISTLLAPFQGATCSFYLPEFSIGEEQTYCSRANRTRVQ